MLKIMNRDDQTVTASVYYVITDSMLKDPSLKKKKQYISIYCHNIDRKLKITESQRPENKSNMVLA